MASATPCISWRHSIDLELGTVPLLFALSTLPLVILVANLVSADETTPNLTGRWRLTSATRDGGPARDVVGHVLRFEEHNFRITSKAGATLYQGTYTIQSDQKPPAIDFKHHRDANKGTIWLGIYRQQGKRLTICDNATNLKAPRPKEFKAPKDSGYIVTKFERIEE